MTNPISSAPFSSEAVNVECLKWIFNKPELIKSHALFDSRPLEFLLEQIAFKAVGDSEILADVRLLQQTICWRPTGEEYVAKVGLDELANELNRWVKSRIEETYEPESAVPVEKLIRVGASVYAANFLYQGDGNKIYEVDNILHDLDAEFLQNITPVDAAQIYLERVISQKITKKQI